MSKRSAQLFVARMKFKATPKPWTEVAKGLPQEQRQRILDTFREGLNIGQVAEKLGHTTDEVAGVILLNIGSYDYLRKDSL